MIQYPSITNYKKIEGVEDIYAFGFNKLDGNNLRFGYSRKKGFHKYGTRTQLIDENNEEFGHGITLFNEKYKKPLEDLFKVMPQFRNKNKITVFCELVGPNSFAGKHVEGEELKLVLFDVYVEDDEAFVPPAEFIKTFQTLDIASDRINGKFDDFILKVVQEDPDLKEGIVFKGVKDGKVIMWKVKTHEWLARAKNEGVKDLE